MIALARKHHGREEGISNRELKDDANTRVLRFYVNGTASQIEN